MTDMLMAALAPQDALQAQLAEDLGAVALQRIGRGYLARRTARVARGIKVAKRLRAEGKRRQRRGERAPARPTTGDSTDALEAGAWVRVHDPLRKETYFFHKFTNEVQPVGFLQSTVSD